ncbi:hypothetical protein GGF37_002351 [Kickxella alabastrina]|nr:hypothetical protein GGF37_002351 [Kickxella alabastrina]
MSSSRKEAVGGPRRSGRMRTQRVLVNVAPPKPTTPPPVMSRRRTDTAAAVAAATSPLAKSAFEGSSHKRRRPNLRTSRSSSIETPPVIAQEDSQRSSTQGSNTRNNNSGTNPVKCFICSALLGGDMDEINAHIDQCLIDTSAENTGGEEGPTVEYEWGGQTRVRATAMLEGGVSAALGFSGSLTVDRDEDVDVDAEDEACFGVAQYSDADLVIKSSESRAGNVPLVAAGGPQWEETPLPLDDEASARAAREEDLRRHSGRFGSGFGSGGASQLVIDALKERIRQQDKLLQSAHKCLICLESYDRPCISVSCWHVYCEKCWLHTLGTKKLCPQCLQITQPTDLRRIYL